MKALHIYAGPQAMAHLQQHGLQPQHVGVVPGAAGGPKGLILGALDRFIFGDWLARSQHPVHLVGASIGAWRMATACLNQPIAAFERLERDYIAQHYHLQPGQKRPTADLVSEQFGQSLARFYGGRVAEVLQHPRYKLHILTSRGRHVLGKEHALATPLGYLGAFLSNSVYRKAMGAWLERVVFSSHNAALPFATADYRTRQVDLSAANFMQALQASCSIPFVLRSVRGIPGAPPGAYWDGGITDYHLHLDYRAPNNKKMSKSIASQVYKTPALAMIDDKNTQNTQNTQNTAPLVLYPHFQQAVVPGWFDKALSSRHKATPFLNHVVLLAPNAEWVKTLPNGKLPDRSDFTRYGADLPARMQAWTTAVRASQQLADELCAWLERPDMGQIRAL